MTIKLLIKGLVQGVGFRPFVYLLAKEMGLKGTVSNTNGGVIIMLNAEENKLDEFIVRLKSEYPTAADIYKIEATIMHGEDVYTGFNIVGSSSQSEEVTQVAPDIAVCNECLCDRRSQPNRIAYPLINCTHCGPRFSIISDLPYDRKSTTMDSFSLCNQCEKEYKDIYDRRFHAQPVACNNCGPFYYAEYGGKSYNDYKPLLRVICELIEVGKVIAVKGIGGYHLVCDAANDNAVNSLREIKQRDTKPFAVMFRDEVRLNEYTFVNETERENLVSWRRPIVLLKQRKRLATGVNEGLRTLGCMLPYMPLHYDLFDHINTSALVMTSGNLSELPIVISAEEADRQFGGKVGLVVHHNREIHNRVDDSVLQVCGGQSCLLRRSRGYVPEPFFADVDVEGILAFGAEKVNTFALGKQDTVIQSQHIGDLKNWETLEFYKESLQRFLHLFKFTPKQLVCDLHPDYMSGMEAETMAAKYNLPLLKIQHHHAHAVACMLEHRLNEPLIAVVWDGTGLGDDGKIWGGEFFLCDRHEYTRLSHLDYIPMPGGDKASDEPWRMAVAYLYHYRLGIPQSFTDRIGEDKVSLLKTMMDKGLNVPLSCGAGRLFDAFSSLLGLCDIATRQAEAPVLLEQVAVADFESIYPMNTTDDTISVHPLFECVLADMEENTDIGLISAKIHNSLAYLIMEKAKQFLKQTGTKKVVLSGGCFQNKRLTEQLQLLFSQEGIPLYIPCKIPCNDGGIAVGQLAIAAARNIKS